MQPLVSIILPCYNAQKYLKYSLDSLINQDYHNLEIICINDGSSDRTLDILNQYKNSDQRIVIINNEKNLGLIASLNNALKQVNGKYFARMDADDYSTPDRISEQVKFMLLNPDIDIVSTAYNYFQINNQKQQYISPIANKGKSLQFLSLFCTVLTHASVLGKTSLINTKQYVYDVNYPYAEDYELFSRLAWNNIKIATIPDALYWVRLHSDSVSVKYNDIQLITNVKIVERNLNQYLKLKYSINTSVLAVLTCRIKCCITVKDIKQAFYIFDECIALFKENMNIYELREVESYLLIHKLNIIIQVNKFRFNELGFKNIAFLLRTSLFFNCKQIWLLFKKIIRKT